MSFVEKLRGLRAQELAKATAEGRGPEEILAEERKRQEAERRFQEKKAGADEQFETLVPFVIEKVHPFLEIVKEAYLGGQGTISFWKDLRYVPTVVSELEWDVSKYIYGTFGKRLRVVTYPNHTLDVLTGECFQRLGIITSGKIDTSKEDWKKEFEETIISKLALGGLSYSVGRTEY